MTGGDVQNFKFSLRCCCRRFNFLGRCPLQVSKQRLSKVRTASIFRVKK